MSSVLDWQSGCRQHSSRTLISGGVYLDIILMAAVGSVGRFDFVGEIGVAELVDIELAAAG